MKRDGTAYYPVLESEIILRKISKKESTRFIRKPQKISPFPVFAKGKRPKA